MRKDHRDPAAAREAALLILAYGIFLVWSIGFLYALFFNREIDAAVHAIMLAVVTALFGGAAGTAILRRNGKNGKNGNGKPPDA